MLLDFGHWFGWLEKGLGEGKGLNLKKAVGTKPYDDKKVLLESFGIDRENYFVSDADEEFPKGFSKV